ncbi:hypothetical protein Q9966_006139 [Columba livia]|nr:hypothetical protein Q9966_006139 [Columba livia]
MEEEEIILKKKQWNRAQSGSKSPNCPAGPEPLFPKSFTSQRRLGIIILTQSQCSFLPKFSIHIETKYEDNKGSNDSVSTMAFADFHLILVVNFGQCSLSEGGTGAARSSKQATKQCSEMGDLLKPLREQRLTAAAFGSHQELPSSPDEKANKITGIMDCGAEAGKAAGLTRRLLVLQLSREFATGEPVMDLALSCFCPNQIFDKEAKDLEREVCFIDIASDEIPERYYKESERTSLESMFLLAQCNHRSEISNHRANKDEVSDVKNDGSQEVVREE